MLFVEAHLFRHAYVQAKQMHWQQAVRVFTLALQARLVKIGRSNFAHDFYNAGGVLSDIAACDGETALPARAAAGKRVGPIVRRR